MQQLKNLIEAALFIAAKPLAFEELKKVKGLEAIPDEELQQILKSMESDYDSHGIRVIEDNGHFELRIKDEFVKSVEHLAPNRDFSRAALQTLSLIAYRSPVKQSEIIDIRGNRAYEHVKELLERGFIKSEAQGHTNILSITQKFLDYFSLKSAEEVKAYFAKKIEKDERKAVKKDNAAQQGEEKQEGNGDVQEQPKEEEDKERVCRDDTQPASGKSRTSDDEERGKKLNSRSEDDEEHMVEEFNKGAAE
ncbi:Segregation and condensation protein B [uncultured archaeon]|nr:Segregation and condensation protein B [uncultured archaeon]